MLEEWRDLGPVFRTASGRVFVNADPCPGNVFVGCRLLVESWCRNRGLDPTGTPDTCALEIRFQNHTTPTAPESTPFIAVVSEQPGSTPMIPGTSASRSARFFTGAAWVWCMDDADARHITTVFGVDPTRISFPPVMLGTLTGVTIPWAPSVHGSPPSIDVLHFGAMHNSPHRMRVLKAVRDALPPSASMVVTSSHFGTALDQLLACTRIVVVPHYYGEPRAYGVHRLGHLLDAPHIHTVVEMSDSSPRFHAWLQKHPSRFTVARTEEIPGAVVEALTRWSSEPVDGAIHSRLRAALHDLS